MYHAIVDLLLKAGHQVPTAHLARADVMEKETTVDPSVVFHRDVNWVLGSDALIAEVSTPSHGVGYEIALALEKKKPVLCCYQHGRRISKMIIGNDMPTLSLYIYKSLDDLLPAIERFLASIQ